MSDAEFNALWADLVSRAYKTDMPSLSGHERHFYAVNLLRGSVSRSGFIGYFENNSSSDIAAAHEGLRELKLLLALALLEKAQNIILKGRLLPENPSCIDAFPASLTEEEYERESDRMEVDITPIQREFYRHDAVIWTTLCEYADSHQLKPG